MKFIVLLVLAVAGYGALVVIANRAQRPEREALAVVSGAARNNLGPTLTMVSWNLGYAGLGKDADFVADGGTSYRYSDRMLVEANLAGIERTLGAHPADVVLLQEITRDSALNHNVPIWTRLSATLGMRDKVFMADVTTRYVPPPLGLDHGAATLSAARIASAERIPLVLEPEFILGFFRKQYALLVTRIAGTAPVKEWVVVNLHLSAFDQGANIRREQLLTTIRFAESEYAKGNHVVLAGDWNMVLHDAKFPHTTEAKFLDWVHPFTPDVLPAGWKLGFDPAAPTVRTLHMAYKPGDNYVAIIDGYLVSPNVEIEEVKTIDLGFEFTDHHPVSARLRAKD